MNMKKNIHTITILLLFALSVLPTYASVSNKSEPTTTYHINKDFNVIPDDPKRDTHVVLITIDDGPSVYGPDMIKTLTTHKAPAIFFINGMHDKANPGNIKRAYDAGFAIGNHTWSHANLSKIKKSSLIDTEINTNTQLIKKITGANPLFFRPPYGASTAYVRDLVKKEGMIFMNWSGAAKDWEKSARDEKGFLSNVTKDLHPGEIILIHEHKWTATYLDKLLTTLAQKGYTFVDPKDIHSS